MFLNNRHYNPQTGTFLSVDPLVTKTGQPYIYGNANPIRYSDPSGLEPCPRTPTGCRDTHAHAAAVHRYNTIKKERNEFSTGCWYECAMDPARGTSSYYDPTSVSGDPAGTKQNIGGCNGPVNCVAGPAIAVAIATAPLVAAELGVATAWCWRFTTLCKTLVGAIGTPLGHAGSDMANGAPTSPAGGPVALGLADDLDDFARAQGAMTYKSWSSGGQFSDDFMRVVGDAGNDVRFNLDGVRSPMASVSRVGTLPYDAALRAGASVTDWELAQIYNNSWTHVQFYNNGARVPSPFGG